MTESSNLPKASSVKDSSIEARAREAQGNENKSTLGCDHEESYQEPFEFDPGIRCPYQSKYASEGNTRLGTRIRVCHKSEILCVGLPRDGRCRSAHRVDLTKLLKLLISGKRATSFGKIEGSRFEHLSRPPHGPA